MELRLPHQQPPPRRQLHQRLNGIEKVMVHGVDMVGEGGALRSSLVPARSIHCTGRPFNGIHRGAAISAGLFPTLQLAQRVRHTLPMSRAVDGEPPD
jgi:hypothetical protein